MTGQELYNIRKNYLEKHHKYSMCLWNLFDYSVLENVMWHKKAGKRPGTYNDVIIMFDTETSKKNRMVIGENHVVAWTLSIRAFDMNIVTLYGHKPRDLVICMENIIDKFKGDETYMYAHNLCYDHWFLRQFFFERWGHPIKQLNTKPHYPLYVRFANGVILKDSLILAQRKLEKWAEDMNVEHKKAMDKDYCKYNERIKGKRYEKVKVKENGKEVTRYRRIYWDYDKIRNQSDDFDDDELIYIENDTLAGVECIQETMRQLNKSIYSLPYTATGIVRGDVQELARENNYREKFLRIVPSYEQYKKLEKVFHGGYTHGNRNHIEQTIRNHIIQAFDFSSSYPYVLLCRKYPCEKFTPEDDMTLEEIVADSDENAYMFRFCATNIRLKDWKHPMPFLQYSKCENKLNPVTDNGRILRADYIDIYLNEIDAITILEQYTWDDAFCEEVEQASKDYLPKWLTDYIYKCYHDNKMLKGVDPVLYAITKAKTNSVYGLTVQKSLKCDIEEYYHDSDEHESGEYVVKSMTEEQERDAYAKYLKKYTSVLPYFVGVWCTSYACRNLFVLGKMCDTWLYSDTDSVYGIGWHMDEVDAYNTDCERQLIERGYEPFTNAKGRKFVLGKAEHDDKEDTYTEFRVMGAKRYCGRNIDDGQLHITVAGVPKKGSTCLNDDISNFKTGFVFDGKTTGKLTHTYFHVKEPYIDENGNETADSIDLSPCDYMLSAIDLEDVFEQEIEVQVYGE